MYIFKCAVVGAGAMGGEIAQVISWAGLPVLLKDVDQKALDHGIATARAVYERRVKAGKLTQSEMDEKMALITPTLAYDEFGDVDFVIEAVPEKLPVKQAVFAELDKVCQSTAILASNTSALSITALGAATKRPGQVVGFHFFNPASVMKLIEVVAGQQTSKDTMDTAVSFAEELRKIPVKVKECAGFVVNRILMASMVEIIKAREELGVDHETVDKIVVQRGGVPMGPFLLGDMLGLDIAADVASTLEKAYGPRFAAPPELKQLVAAGNLGVKTGKGFYTHTKAEG
ncbi:MAG TPA: 3-hydroxyacyl-CoA dehydrogenase family protein [Candidatus Eremiobacteraceae bacterium]|jgi:3-hydroxyacyl-CoA dehydrogenase|nr:3-hydroxyacyl-CoA dehydrogenase family protein [Candidatus Eremiobacteraceae bacterium]